MDNTTKNKYDILLAIKDAIISLDVEDILNDNFECNVSYSRISEIPGCFDIIQPDMVILDCDFSKSELHAPLELLKSKDALVICMCSSEDQREELLQDFKHIILKPFDFDEFILNVKAAIQLRDQSNPAAEDIASGP